MISDSVLFIHGCLVRRPVVGYLNRPEMASNRLCNTSIARDVEKFINFFYTLLLTYSISDARHDTETLQTRTAH